MVTENKDLPKTRKEAKFLSEPYYFTGIPCKNGHVYKRAVSSGHCKMCDRQWSKKHRDKPSYNEERRKKYQKRTEHKRRKPLVKGDKIGGFIFDRYGTKGKNKVLICICECGNEKALYKESAAKKMKTCGCRIDTERSKNRAFKSRYNSYFGGARSRNLLWELSFSYFKELVVKDCYYCGRPPTDWNMFKDSKSLRKDSPRVDIETYTIPFSGVDRLDSKLGYNKQNCVPCCKYCNRAKSDLSLEGFKTQVEAMYMHLFKNK